MPQGWDRASGCSTWLVEERMNGGDFGSGSWCTVKVRLGGWNKNFADVVKG